MTTRPEIEAALEDQARKIARCVRGCATDEQYRDLVDAIARALLSQRDEVIEECAQRIRTYRTGLIPEFQIVADWIEEAISSLKSSNG